MAQSRTTYLSNYLPRFINQFQIQIATQQKLFCIQMSSSTDRSRSADKKEDPKMASLQTVKRRSNLRPRSQTLASASHVERPLRSLSRGVCSAFDATDTKSIPAMVYLASAPAADREAALAELCARVAAGRCFRGGNMSRDRGAKVAAPHDGNRWAARTASVGLKGSRVMWRMPM